MSLKEILRIALGSIGANKLRSILTMLGITIGVFSVIGVMTAVSALRGSIESGLSFLGSNMFQFSKYPAINNGGPAAAKYRNRRDITYEEGERYRSLMRDASDIVCLKTFDQGVVQAFYQNRHSNPGLTFAGTNQYFLAANQYTIAYGRNLTQEDVAFARPVIVIGKSIQDSLFPNESPLGKRIRVNTGVYTIVGVFAEKGTTFGQSQDDILIIPITRYLSDFGSRGRTINIATQAPSQQLYAETLDKAITAMRIVRGLKPEQDNDFEIYSNDSLLAAFAKIADIVRSGAFIISAIALVAAGVGIMNIMLVSVTERTREIGIRKSIGAKKTDILAQFLIEAVTLSLAGGIFGIFLGVGGGNGLALFLKASVVFPWGWAAAGVLVCTAIGMGFGLYPAWKAASLDPIEALRYE